MKKILIAVMAMSIICSCGNCQTKTSKASNVPAKTESTAVKAEANKPMELSTADFKAKIWDFTTDTKGFRYKGSRPAVVDMYATWCGPCRQLAPIMEKMSALYAGKVDFFKVDVDKATEVASALGVESIPLVLYITADGKYETTLGSMPEEDLKANIETGCLGAAAK